MANPKHLPPAVVFDAVSVRYGRVSILDTVNALVPRGSNTVLVGPNGAGKTSLLLCLLRELPYRGNITLLPLPDGRQPRLAYVPQQMTLPLGLPLLVEEFILLNLGGRPLWFGRKAGEITSVKACLAMVDAQNLCKRRLSDLSGGELRRVLLAAALGRKPDILVLDEAEAGVDVRGEALFWEILNSTRQAYGFTQIMVSHNLSLTAHYATHVICLNKSVQVQGPPRNCLDAAQLYRLFGIPIHLYPEQCELEVPGCPECGAFSHAAHEHGTTLAPVIPVSLNHQVEDNYA